MQFHLYIHGQETPILHCILYSAKTPGTIVMLNIPSPQLSIDINECSLGPMINSCAIEATCTDTDGSYFCTCSVGYTGDGMLCQS